MNLLFFISKSIRDKSFGLNCSIILCLCIVFILSLIPVFKLANDKSGILYPTKGPMTVTLVSTTTIKTTKSKQTSQTTTKSSRIPFTIEPFTLPTTQNSLDQTSTEPIVSPTLVPLETTIVILGDPSASNLETSTSENKLDILLQDGFRIRPPPQSPNIIRRKRPRKRI